MQHGRFKASLRREGGVGTGLCHAFPPSALNFCCNQLNGSILFPDVFLDQCHYLCICAPTLFPSPPLTLILTCYQLTVVGQVCSCSDIDTDSSSYRKIMIRGGKKRNFYCTKKCELYTVHLQVEYLFMAKLIFFYPFACACISETGDPNTCWITGFEYFCFHLLCYCFNT